MEGIFRPAVLASSVADQKILQRRPEPFVARTGVAHNGVGAVRLPQFQLSWWKLLPALNRVTVSGSSQAFSMASAISANVRCW